MVEIIIKIDLDILFYDNDMVYNCWYFDIFMVVMVKFGDDFIVECYDWIGGQIYNDDNVEDVCDVDLIQVYFLFGLVGVEGVEFGDLLVVDIFDIGIFEESQWGFNGFFFKQNGGGFFIEYFLEVQKIIWDFNGMFIKFWYIFGVEFVGLIYSGLIGCLFFKEMFNEWNICEKVFYDIELDCVFGLVNLLFVDIVYMGKFKGSEKVVVVVEGVCIVLFCEYGGNCDIKDLLCGL